MPGDGLADLSAPARHNRHRGVFLDAVNDEVERSRSRQVREDGIQRRLDTEHRHRNDKQDDVESEDRSKLAELIGIVSVDDLGPDRTMRATLAS